MNDHELYHWGIKGMKWGVRRYQNKDGTLTPAGRIRYAEVSDKKIVTNSDGSRVVPKDFVFNRVGKNSMDVNESGALYVSYGERDAARYVKNLGPTLIGNLFNTSAHYVQHIKTKGELKIPSDDETVSLTIDSVMKNRDIFYSFKDSLYSMTATDDPLKEISMKDIEKAFSSDNKKEKWKMAYAINSMLGDPYYANESKKIYDEFRKNGYDAIPDLHDQLSGTSETAMIVINPEKLLITSTVEISKDVQKEAKNYVKLMGKLPISELIK